MIILGVRNGPKQIRYALVDATNTSYTLLNPNSEHCIRKPAGIKTEAEHLKWVYDELTRVLRQNPKIERVALKTPEYNGKRSSASRLGDYLDAMVLLTAADVGITVVTRIYKQMGTKRSDVVSFAESHVGRTTTLWNEQMADAVAVAWSAKP